MLAPGWGAQRGSRSLQVGRMLEAGAISEQELAAERDPAAGRGLEDAERDPTAGDGLLQCPEETEQRCSHPS